MKKIVLFITLSISASISFAQLNLGLKTSWTINKLQISSNSENVQFFNQDYTNNDKFGLCAGAIANYKLNHWLSLQSELLFDAVNTSFYKMEYYTNAQGNQRATGNYFKVQMQYFQMPLVGKLSFGNKVTFDLFAGGFVSYMLSAKQSTLDGQLYLPKDLPYNPMMDPQQITIPYPTQKVDADYTNFNAGVLVGCGITMLDRVILEIRVNRGMVNINKADASKISTLQGQFTVGYYLFRQKNKASAQ